MVNRRNFIKSGLIFVPTAYAQAQLATQPCRRKAFSSGGGGPTETPATYSGLQVWYRSSDLSATLVDNDPVSTWTDQSGNANDATGILAGRPTFKTNIIGSVPVLRYAGTQTLTMGSVLSYTTGQPWTFMALTKPTSSVGSFLGRAVNALWRLKTDSTFNYYDTATNYLSSAITGALTDLKISGLRRSNGGNNVSFRENKLAKGTELSTAGSASFNLIGNADFGLAFNGDFVELAVWNVMLTDGQCDSLYDNYFKVLYTTLP